MIIFVKVRNDEGNLYDSYDDYWKLVNLSKFESCELDEVNPNSENIYVFSPDNGNVKECCKREHKAKYILWQMERGIEGAIKDYFDEIWVSDRYFHSLINHPKCKYVILGGHLSLGGRPKEPKKWDYVHLSYLLGRRKEKIDNLIKEGYTIAPNGWGEVKEKSLAYSKMGICFHQDEMPIIEPLRYVLFACWKLPMLAEFSQDFFPYAPLNAQENYKLMTEKYTFRKCVEGAV